MAADTFPGHCLLVGAPDWWIIENVDAQPQSTVPGWLRWSPAVQSENSRSVLASWLPLGDATSSLAGTDRSVTSLIRTQLHRHIKGLPPHLLLFIAAQSLGYFSTCSPTPQPPPPFRQKKEKGGKPFTSYFLSEGKEQVEAAAKFWVISVPLLLRRCWIMIMTWRMLEEANEASH